MRILEGTVFATCLLLNGIPHQALAASADYETCAGHDDATTEERIAACTSALKRAKKGSEAYIEIIANRGGQELVAGQNEEAIADFNFVIPLEKKDSLLRLVVPKTYGYAAQAYYNTQSYHLAVSFLDHQIDEARKIAGSLTVNYDLTQELRGDIFMQQSKFTRAAGAYAASLESYQATSGITSADCERLFGKEAKCDVLPGYIKAHMASITTKLGNARLADGGAPSTPLLPPPIDACVKFPELC